MNIHFANEIDNFEPKNMTIYNLVNQASDVPSIIFFIISDRLRALKTLNFYFFKLIKKIEK